MSARNKAILFNLLDTGICCSELVQLSHEDLDLDDQQRREGDKK